ncbi:LLM class flavin-dependent oxidoreductase [Planotetraspora sp. GP83]|uniref:LLM class flavin-dependent oxidoreductase n=1 Tax=Planotetraspora sp. GP83 TaxID=3156264 RepID=UPI003517CECD
MTEFFVTLPTRGDGVRGDWHPDFQRPLPPSFTDVRQGVYGPFDHLAQIGRAAEIAGLTGVLAPFDPQGEESTVVAAGLLRQNRNLRVQAEFHPGIATPVYAAKIAVSLQRFSGGRLDWRLAVDLDPDVARSQGYPLEDRYARADEFLTVAKGVWHEPGYTFEGRFYEVLNGGFSEPPFIGQAFPRVHLSGTSPEALALSARHADVHVFDPGDDLEAAIPKLPGVRYGLRLPSPAGRDEEEQAAVIRDYIDRGVSAFFLEVEPHIEETYRFGERLLPLLVKEGAHAH